MTDAPLIGTLQHSIAGRIRIRLADPVPDDAALAQLAEAINSFASVEAVTIRPTTGSLIILFAGAPESLLETITAAGLLRVDPPEPVVPYDPVAAVASGLSAADLGFGKMTGGRADLAGLAFTGLLAAAIVQIARGRIAGPAITLLGQAATVAMMRSAGRR